jgi:hypothetical protein
MSIEAQLFSAAQSNVDALNGEFTEAEKISMVKIEELKLINGMDLAALLLRGKILKEIEDQALFSFHPGGYLTMEEMARDQGIGISELSNVRDLCYTIFPYMEANGMSVAVTFEAIGKSNFRELVPALKAIITGVAPSSERLQETINRLMDDTAATAAVAGEEITPEEIRDQTVLGLLTRMQGMTNRTVRHELRPEHAPTINATVINNNGTRIFIAELNDDQMTILTRRLQGYVDPIEFVMPREARQRQAEASRIAVIRNLLNLIGG